MFVAGVVFNDGLVVEERVVMADKVFWRWIF
jgi:hypothetical protein